MHVADDHFFVEAVDPEAGDRLDERERRELLVPALLSDVIRQFGSRPMTLQRSSGVHATVAGQ